MANKWKLSSSFVLNGKGRMCRRDFIMFNVVLFVLGIILSFVYMSILHLIGFSEMDSETNPMTNNQLFMLIGLIFCVLCFMIPISMFLIFASIRRLHDMNLSGWWLLLLILLSAPLFKGVGEALCTIFLMAKKGSIGENKYGVDPLE